MDRLVASQRWGRAHDTTLCVLDEHEGADRGVVVVRKPRFPPGYWRPPSGGAHPGESMEAGALREALLASGSGGLRDRAHLYDALLASLR